MQLTMHGSRYFAFSQSAALRYYFRVDATQAVVRVDFNGREHERHYPVEYLEHRYVELSHEQVQAIEKVKRTRRPYACPR
jgi:hypothetical protein